MEREETPRLEGKEGVNLNFEDLYVRKRRKNPFFLLALILLIIAAGLLLAKMIYLYTDTESEDTADGEFVEVWQGAFESEEIFLESKKSSVSVVADGKLCSGFVYSSDGWIVTSNDAVNFQTRGKIKVRLHDGRTYNVIAFKESRKAGISLMKIDAKNLCAVKFFSGERLLEGQELYTFCALSESEESSLFSGEIAHLGRRVTFQTDNGRRKVLSLMQISVLLTQEGVGAPFFNASGELVGMGVVSTDGSDPHIISYAYLAKDIENLLKKMKNGESYSDGLFPFVLE